MTRQKANFIFPMFILTRRHYVAFSLCLFDLLADFSTKKALNDTRTNKNEFTRNIRLTKLFVIEFTVDLEESITRY